MSLIGTGITPYRRPELYKDCRLGKYDIIIWGRTNGEIKIGRIEKLSKVTKARSDDGSNLDQRGDPHFYYVYPKFHPDESVFKIRPIELKICDRYLRIGFLVKEFETGRIGYVQGIKQLMSVKLLNTKLILRDVEFRDLIDPWKLNVQYKRPVYYNGWVGRISGPVQRKVYVRFIEKKVRPLSFSIGWNDLAHILVECGIVKIGTFSFESSGFAFWPGKRYKLPKRILLNSKYTISWDNEAKPQTTVADGFVTIHIIKTEVLPFLIQWTRRLPGFETPKPSDHFSDADVQNIDFIRPNLTSYLGDIRMYRLKPHDSCNLISEDSWKMLLRRRYCLPRVRPEITSKEAEDSVETKETNNSYTPLNIHEEVPVEVIYTRSTAEVAWVDGKISRVDSCKICRVKNEYLEVGSFVEPVALPGINAFGVVQQVKVQDKTLTDESSAVVKWFYFGNDEDPEEQTYETELPMKLLLPHTKFSFKSKTCMNVLVARASSDQDFTVGFVVNTYPDGKVRVRCADGIVRRFWPFEITRISSEIRGHENDTCYITESSFSLASETGQGEKVLSKSLNSFNWKKILQKASMKSLSWREEMAIKQQREKLTQVKLRLTQSTKSH